MTKRYVLKTHQLEQFAIGEMKVDHFKHDGKKVYFIQIGQFSSNDMDHFTDQLQEIIGTDCDIVLTNFPMTINLLEVVEVDDSKTRFEREWPV
jgi:hypothetical protein